MAEKSWKQHLLSSGIPLEYSVRRVLEGFDLFHPSEFRYERLNEAGLLTVFSVDLHTTQIYTASNLWLDLLIECKYRHDTTKWIFTPHEFNDLWGTDFSDIFLTVDQFAGGRTINTREVEAAKGFYHLCEKGIEIGDKGPNPNSLRHAMQQLRYAVVERYLSNLDSQIDDGLGSPTPLFVVIPIIVTTAELWRLNAGTTIETIRDASDLAEVASTHELLFLHDPPDNELRRHSTRRFKEVFPEQNWGELTGAMYKHRRAYGTFSGLAHNFASHYPSMFVVVHYTRVRSALDNLFRFFRQAHLIRSPVL